MAKKINGNFKKERNGNARLIQKQVDTIREVYKTEKLSQRELADKFNISKTHARRIIKGICWV